MRCDTSLNKEDAVAIHLPAFESVLSGQCKKALTLSNLKQHEYGKVDARELLRNDSNDTKITKENSKRIKCAIVYKKILSKDFLDDIMRGRKIDVHIYVISYCA